MPPILWVFFVGVGLATVPPVIGGLTKGVDPNTRHKFERTPQEYRVWSVPASSRPRKECAGTTFAMATRGRVIRLRVDGEEQVLDTSWRFDHRLGNQDYVEQRYVFLDPVGGAELACRWAKVSCVSDGGRGWRFRSSQGVCYESLRVVEEARSEPELEVIAPRFVNSTMRRVGQSMWQGDFDLRIVVRIVGPMNGEWWCPEVEVEWPDRTRSTKGADCDPWTGSDEQRRTRFSWTFSHRLIPGDNEVKVRLRNAGGVFKATRVTVTVR